MTIDIGKFTASKLTILNYFEGASGGDVQKTVSMGAQITGVPCIVIAFWLGERIGWTVEILETISRLINFYGYTEILGKPTGAPE